MCLYKAPSDTPRWQENNNKTESVGACTRCPLHLSRLLALPIIVRTSNIRSLRCKCIHKHGLAIKLPWQFIGRRENHETPLCMNTEPQGIYRCSIPDDDEILREFR